MEQFNGGGIHEVPRSDLRRRECLGSTSRSGAQAEYERYRAFSAEAGGKIAGGAETAPTRTATTVRVRAGDTAVTDGPFEDLDEPLGGFFVFDCANMDEAVELATRIPGAATGAVEVRPAYVEETTS